MAQANQFLVVLTNCPDQPTAEKIAKQLVESRLAACVNVLAPCLSVYRWQGAVEEGPEVPLLIKTTAERYSDVEGVIRLHHPYELPEIIALPLSKGLPGYLDWIADESRPG